MCGEMPVLQDSVGKSFIPADMMSTASKAKENVKRGWNFTAGEPGENQRDEAPEK